MLEVEIFERLLLLFGEPRTIEQLAKRGDSSRYAREPAFFPSVGLKGCLGGIRAVRRDDARGSSLRVFARAPKAVAKKTANAPKPEMMARVSRPMKAIIFLQ